MSQTAVYKCEQMRRERNQKCVKQNETQREASAAAAAARGIASRERERSDGDAPGDFEQTPGEEEPQEVRVALHATARPHDDQQDEEAVRELYAL